MSGASVVNSGREQLKRAEASDESDNDLEQIFSLVIRVEFWMALVATAVLLYFHYVAFVANPALWRDEIAAVNLAQVPTWDQFWRLCEYDSSFFAWFGVLHTWIKVCGGSDVSLRVLGTGVGVLLLGACWWTGRRFESAAPLVALSIFALNPVVIYWGDTVRGYGLGTLLMLLMYATTWQFCRQPTWRNWCLALLPALGAVHTLYYNCIYLFAMCMGVLAVQVRGRRWRAGVQILGLGFLCAVSMVIYLDPVRRVGTWRNVVESPLSIETVAKLFHGTSVYAAYVVDVVWILVLPLVPALLAYMAFRKPVVSADPPTGRSAEILRDVPARSLYLLVTLAVGLGGFLTLLFWHGYQPQPWHFVPLLGFVSVPIEVGTLDAVRYQETSRKLRLYLMVTFWLIVAYSTYATVDARRTNVDLALQKLNPLVQPDDLVVIHPWFVGITFGRYYTGAAPWVAAPGMESESLNVHRYDIIRDMLKVPDPNAALLKRIEQQLRAGKTVWYLGTYLPMSRNKFIGKSPPPLEEHSKFGSALFLYYWNKLFYKFFSDHSNFEAIPVSGSNSFGHENVGLLRVTGWQDQKPEDDRIILRPGP